MKALLILLVEDSAIIGMLLAEMLEEMGHKVCAIESQEDEAVIAALRHRPDLMIVDAWLREGSGISAVERISQTTFIPHIFVTGDAAGVKDLVPHAIIIQKPFNEADLVSAIQRAVPLG